MATTDGRNGVGKEAEKGMGSRWRKRVIAGVTIDGDGRRRGEGVRVGGGEGILFAGANILF
jgi:hypothetical protein